MSDETRLDDQTVKDVSGGELEGVDKYFFDIFVKNNCLTCAHSRREVCPCGARETGFRSADGNPYGRCCRWEADQ